jgi:hypothetical protein
MLLEVTPRESMQTSSIVGVAARHLMLPSVWLAISSSLVGINASHSRVGMVMNHYR